MKDTIFNLYITFGTLPCLYAQMNVFQDSNPSYIWAKNGGEFINKKYYSQNLIKYTKIDGFDDKTFLEKSYKLIEKEIIEIKKSTPNIKFNIYCDDSRIQFILKFIKLLEGSINKTVMISEGNITEYMSRNITEESLEEKKKKWNNFLTSIRTNSLSEEDINKMLAVIDNYSFYLSTLNNYEYLIPNLDLLLKNTLLDKISENMNLFKIDFVKIFNQLSPNVKNEFIKNAINDLELFSMIKTDKNVLIINGTYNFGNEEITAFIYSNLINKVIDDYKDKYTLFYKAHPLFPVDNNLDLREFLKNNNIKVLPEKFPIELVLWRYKNIKIGGFCSSIHSLVSKKQVEFIFGELNGFSKYIFKDNFIKLYNLNLSQDIASLMLKYYYKLSDIFIKSDLYDIDINNIKNDLKVIFEKINICELDNCSFNAELQKIYQKINSLEKTNLLLIDSYKENQLFILKLRKVIKFIFSPIIWIKNLIKIVYKK